MVTAYVINRDKLMLVHVILILSCVLQLLKWVFMMKLLDLAMGIINLSITRLFIFFFSIKHVCLMACNIYIVIQLFP